MKLFVHPTDQVTIMDTLKSCGLFSWHRYTMRVVAYQNNITLDINMSPSHLVMTRKAFPNRDVWPLGMSCLASVVTKLGSSYNEITPLTLQ